MNILASRKSARWHWARAQQRCREREANRPRVVVAEECQSRSGRGNGDGVRLHVRRNEVVERVLRVGPNAVSCVHFHADGTFTDVGVSHNLLTNIGRDVWSSWMGGFQTPGNTLASNISTGTSGTTITGTGSVWTASNLATPQIGASTFRVYAAPHTTTNPVVWGNVVSNTTNVLTIDQWWKAAAASGGPPITGTTPTSGDAFVLSPGGIGSIQFMAISTNASAASASDTVLASEVTSNGGGRVLATYAHTQGASSLTLSNTFTFSGTVTAVHKGGLFCTLSAAGADPVIFETVLNADFTAVNGDTAALTWTINPSG